MLKKTLYVLALRGRTCDSLFMLYAVDETEAEERAKDLENEYSGSRASLKAYPRGFRIVTCELPGTVEVEETE